MTYCIVVPCYNESQRLLSTDYLQFVKEYPEFHLIFVDDGSTDNTFEIIEDLSKQSANISAIKQSKNTGKAQAIRFGMEHIINQPFDCIGYLDADLAIPFSELLRLKDKLGNGYDFVFSSKKVTEGSDLEYKFKRYFVGRVLSSMVKMSLKTSIFDTQCGCKLMIKDVAKVAFKDPFINSWLFDIEILWRLIIEHGNTYIEEKTLEVPVMKLIDRGSSRIKATDLISLPFQFIKIHLHYRKLKRSTRAKAVAQ